MRGAGPLPRRALGPPRTPRIIRPKSRFNLSSVPPFYGGKRDSRAKSQPARERLSSRRRSAHGQQKADPTQSFGHGREVPHPHLRAAKADSAGADQRGE